MEKYNGCSVPQYRRYPMLARLSKGGRMRLFGTTVVRMVHSSALIRSDMGRTWHLLAAAIMCLCSLSGCLGGAPLDYHYSAEDAEGAVSSEGINDQLFNVTLTEQGATDMKFSSLVVVVTQDGASYRCLPEGEGGNCTVTQPSGSDDALWEEGETLTVSERGTDICGRTCILTFSINGPSGTQTTGPTVLTLN